MPPIYGSKVEIKHNSITLLLCSQFQGQPSLGSHLLPNPPTTHPNIHSSLVLLPLIDEVDLCRPHVDDLGATVAVLFQDRALVAIVRVCDPFVPANDAFPLETYGTQRNKVRGRVQFYQGISTHLKGPVVALVADLHHRARRHQRVAYHALVLAALAHAPDRLPRLLPAQHEVGVVARHVVGARWK